MKILHLNAGNETVGGMHHILGLLNALNREEFVLGVLEKGELYKRATNAGIRTVHFSSNTRMSIPLLHKMIRYIKRENINVVHTHGPRARSEEHTSELQSRGHLVCRLLLEKKKVKKTK